MGFITRALLTCLPLVVLAGRAQGADSGDEGARPRARVDTSAAAGSFLAFTHPAALDSQDGYATGMAGYDSARKSGLYEAAAEVRLWGPLSIRGGALYGQTNQRLRPSFGARVQALHESRSGVDAALGVFYRPEGLTEAEGELEAVVSTGAHLAGTYLLANLVYGQDPQGNERDGEIRLGAVRSVSSRLLLGLDGRLRYNLGSSAAKPEPKLDAFLGPAATVLVGPVALLAQAGASAFRLDAGTDVGMFVLGGLGAAF
jgi:hypothetical protein